MAYILILLSIPVFASSGKAIHSVEFGTKADCEAAAVVVRAQELTSLRALCVAKGTAEKSSK